MDVIVPDKHFAPAVLPRAFDTAVVGRDDRFRRVLACEPSAYPGGTRVQDNGGDFIYARLTDNGREGLKELEIPPPYSTVEGAWFEERVGWRLDIIAGECLGAGRGELSGARGGWVGELRLPSPIAFGAGVVGENATLGDVALGPPLWE